MHASFNAVDPVEFLKFCDKLRDEQLVDLGVQLDDRASGAALVKFVPAETLKAQRDEKAAAVAAKAKEKERKKKEEEEKARDRLMRGKVAPVCALLN